MEANNKDDKSVMQCAEFEALLADALDATPSGTAADARLSGPKLESFQAHRQACAVCGPMFAEAEAGMKWLSALSPVEPPRNLVRNILLATSGAETSPSAQRAFKPWPRKLREWASPILGPVTSNVLQPRFAMSFGMAFFSLSMVLTVAGVKFSDLRRLDLRPTAVRNELVRGYYETAGRVVKYYENLRFVYEIESRVRDLKRATTPEENSPPPKPKNRNGGDKTSGDPSPRDKDKDQYYSREERSQTVASRRGHHDPASAGLKAGLLLARRSA